MEFKRKSKKMKKRFTVKRTPYPYILDVTVKSFLGKRWLEEEDSYPVIEINNVDGKRLLEPHARRLAKALIAHADRIKRYKENERARCKS